MKYRINPEEIEIKEFDGFDGSTLISLQHLGILIPIEEKEFPQYGDKYFYVSSAGKIKSGGIYSLMSQGHDYRKHTGNMFRTQKDAQAYKDKIMGV